MAPGCAGVGRILDKNPCRVVVSGRCGKTPGIRPRDVELDNLSIEGRVLRAQRGVGDGEVVREC